MDCIHTQAQMEDCFLIPLKVHFCLGALLSIGAAMQLMQSNVRLLQNRDILHSELFRDCYGSILDSLMSNWRRERYRPVTSIYCSLRLNDQYTYVVCNYHKIYVIIDARVPGAGVLAFADVERKRIMQEGNPSQVIVRETLLHTEVRVCVISQWNNTSTQKNKEKEKNRALKGWISSYTCVLNSHFVNARYRNCDSVVPSLQKKA